jgi:phosphoglycerate dehydrogenase-like enzyme
LRSVIVVHPNFDKTWPFAADHLHHLWMPTGNVELIRVLSSEERAIDALIKTPETVDRLVSFMAPLTLEALERFRSLQEAVLYTSAYGDQPPEAYLEALSRRGVRIYKHQGLGFWGQSVAEFALALTICALRRIPQLHHEMISSLKPWNYDPPAGVGAPGARGEQFSDDPRFTHGTVEGKRVRIVGAGNIASRYASFVSFMGADVAAWDPYASDPCFHRSGARREQHLSRLLVDAEVFAPMLPLTASTRGLITAEHINALPKGGLVVLVTRANICDVGVLKERVLNDELSLAADVFDLEPLSLEHPFLGRHNVVHTPHVAGRTKHANLQLAEALSDLFLSVNIYRE